MVEGRYDKAALSSCVDAVIVDTEGFGIFSDREKLALLRRLAEQRGLVILTDSDGGGFLIRNFLKSSLGSANVRHAYIPDVYGKERRKKKRSAEGKLGVEGMPPEVLLDSLRRAGVTPDAAREEPRLTKADLYAAGLSGRPDSSSRRTWLLKELSLPARLSPNALLDVLNVLISGEEFANLVNKMNENCNF